jgi:hypothetical protein
MIIVTAMAPILRRFLAVAAAYAVALQAVLAAFAIPAPSVAAQFVICRADPTGAPADPVSHKQCDACLVGHCGGAASPEPIAVTIPRRSLRIEARSPRLVASAPQPRTYSHAPRAPPRA